MRPLTAILCLLLLAPQAMAADAHVIDQGWTVEQADGWYDGTQGSRLIPLVWLQALEQPDATAPFLADAYMVTFGYLPRTNRAGQRLPLGFAVDNQDDEALGQTRLRWRARQGAAEPWVGMNCAACHTGQITFRGQDIRIDGGPALTDFQSLLEALNKTLVQTQSDPAKWDRFASRILARDDTGGNRALLRGAFAQLTEWHAAQLRLNDTPLRYGFGRLDAFGHIYNKVTAIAEPANPAPNPADAPVSYPFLWGVANLPRVQYNAIAPNLPFRSPLSGATFDIGALGRNTGEVIGVFADVVAHPDPGPIAGYRSSVDVAGIVGLEQLLMQLRPPRWPDELFGRPDPALVATGARLFGGQCASCHLPSPPPGSTAKLEERFSYFNADSARITGKGLAPNTRNDPPGTDAWMACNAYQRASKSGVMQGLPAGYIPGKPAIPAAAPIADLLGTAVAAVLAGDKGAVVRTAAATYFGGDLPPHVVTLPAPSPFTPAATETRAGRLQRCMTEISAVLGYKSRPLAGIWATAPYLHNGSVPTLHDLLLPPADRPRSFAVGGREFDPKNVGFVANPGRFEFRVDDEAGTPIPGNANAGHDYGNAALTPADRDALVEYLKTL